jgi:hypothetical protein
MAAIPMLRRNVEFEVGKTANYGASAWQHHIPNNFTFGQPEKAIGHESQIEPWLTLTTKLFDASETDERRYASKMNLENWENRGSSHQYVGWMSERISLRLPVAGEVFFLTSPYIEQCYIGMKIAGWSFQ